VDLLIRRLRIMNYRDGTVRMADEPGTDRPEHMSAERAESAAPHSDHLRLSCGICQCWYHAAVEDCRVDVCGRCAFFVEDSSCGVDDFVGLVALPLGDVGVHRTQRPAAHRRRDDVDEGDP